MGPKDNIGFRYNYTDNMKMTFMKAFYLIEYME